MKFWDLPILVAVRVLTEWMEMKEIGKFDSATVNQAMRPFLLNLYKSQSAVFMGLSQQEMFSLLAGDVYYVWIKNRGVSVRCMAIIQCSPNLENLITILGDGPFSRTLKLIVSKLLLSMHKPLGSTSVVRLGHLFPNLEMLKFQNCDVSDDGPSRTAFLVSEQTIFPHLQNLIVDKCILHGTSLSMIIHKGVNFQSIELNSVKFVEDTCSNDIITTNNLLSIADNCPNLSTLTLKRFYVPSVVFEAMTLHCKLLADIHLIDCGARDSWLINIANNCHIILRNLIMDNFILTDPNTMTIFAEKCTEVEHIEFRGVICQYTCGTISCDVIPKHCTKLKTFEVDCNNGVLFSEVGLHSLLTHCKQIEVITIFDTQKGAVPQQSVQPSSVLPCMKLQKVNLFYTRKFGALSLTSQTMRFLADSAPNLTEFDINACDEVNDDVIIYIANRCKKLRNLRLYNCNQLSERAIAALATNCRELITLDMRRTYATTVADVQKIVTACKKLEKILWSYKGAEPIVAMEKLIRKKHPKVQLICVPLR